MFSNARVEMVERLKEKIRQLQAAPRQYLVLLRTGIALLDGLLPAGGFVLGQTVELWGHPASGRTTLVLRALAAAHREERLCAYVDGPQTLYPPAAAALGVDLKRLLWVRPRAPKQLVWATLQLLRSGTFIGVALDLTGTGVRLSLEQSKKLSDAASMGGSALWVLTPPEAPAEGLTRLSAQAEHQGLWLEIVRGRQGGMGRRVFLPWESLYPGHPGRALSLPQPAAAEALLLKRPTGIRTIHSSEGRFTAEDRNGPPGIIGQRPGRDTALPELQAVFGLSEAAASRRIGG